MEYIVHRCKFSEWAPSPIRSIAPDAFSSLVAVGRADGDIEICNSSSKWFVQCRIPGTADFQLRKLLFSTMDQEAGRLFGISLRGVLFEVDITTLSIKNVRDSYGGAAWALAASTRGPILAVGCEDGAGRLFTYESGKLEYLKSFASTGSRVLSVAFHPASPQLYLGCADGTIRCLEENSGKNLFRLTGDIMRGLSTHIWSLLVLSDSTVVSGDNRGHLQFWDGITGVLMSTIHQHTADILCIATDKDEMQVFASGIDSKVTCIRRISATFRLPGDASSTPATRSPTESQWVYTTAHRPHTHDVYSLAVCPNIVTIYSGEDRSSTVVETLLSGGVDCKLCLYPTSDFMKTRPTWVLPTPAHGLVSVSGDHSAIAVKHKDHVNIWNFNIQHEGDGSSAPASLKHAESNLRLDKRVDSSTDAFFHTIAMSPNGKYLIISSASGTRMYSINNRKHASSQDAFLPMTLPLEVARSLCQCVSFSPDGVKIVVVYSKPSSGTNIAMMSIDNGSMKLTSSKKRKKLENGLGEAVDGVSPEVSMSHMFRHSTTVREAIADSLSSLSGGRVLNKNRLLDSLEFVCNVSGFNSTGRWLAVASASGRVFVYDMEAMAFHWRTPAFSSPVSAMAFHTRSENSLVIVLADNSFWIYDVVLMQLSPWSAQYAEKIPSAVRNIPGPIEGIVFDHSRLSVAIFFGQGFSVFVDLNAPIPDVPKKITPMLNVDCSMALTKKQKKKRRSSAGGTSSNFAIVSTYRSLLHVGCLESSELVVIENPWVHVLGMLPDTLARDRYGT